MSKWPRLLGGAVFGVFLSAPAAAQQPPAAAASTAPVVPPAPAEPVLPTVDDPMLAAPPPPQHLLKTWQEALGQLRSNSTTLKSARARVQQAEANASLALSPALPRLGAVGRVENNFLRGTRTQSFGTLSVSTEVPNPAFWATASLALTVPIVASQAWYDHGTAKDTIRSAELDQKEIERQQVAITAVAIVGVVTSERLAEVTRVSLGSALANLDLSKRRAALGASSTIDVLRVEQEVALSRAQVVQAHEVLMRSRETLGDALGSPESWGVQSGIELSTLAKEARSTCTQAAGVELRPDVMAATQAARVAERNVTSVDYTWVPTVDGYSNLTYYSSTLSSPTAMHAGWTIGATLAWNIYDGGVRSGSRGARRADLELAQQRQSETRRKALIEVTQTLRDVTVAEANLVVSQKSREIAAETARLTKIAYVNGTGTSFDLVDTARQLREAELDYTIKEFQLARAKIAALLALSTCNI